MSPVKATSALAAIAIAAAATAALAGGAPTGHPAMEKCFGVAKSGKNDCKAGAGTSCAGTCDDVDDSRRKSGFLDYFSKQQCGE